MGISSQTAPPATSMTVRCRLPSPVFCRPSSRPARSAGSAPSARRILIEAVAPGDASGGCRM